MSVKGAVRKRDEVAMTMPTLTNCVSFCDCGFNWISLRKKKKEHS